MRRVVWPVFQNSDATHRVFTAHRNEERRVGVFVKGMPPSIEYQTSVSP